MNFLQKFISRKLLVFILTPIISGAIVLANQFLPVGAQFTPDQILSAINWVVNLAMVAIAAQGTVDAIEKVKTPKVAIPIEPTNIMQNAPIPEDMK
jgi:hypothetical protein